MSEQPFDGWYCIVQDESAHYYVIPVELKDKFYEWSEGYLTDEDYDYDLFTDMRINGHPSRVKFKDYVLYG